MVKILNLFPIDSDSNIFGNCPSANRKSVLKVLQSNSPERFECGGFTLGATPGPEANRKSKVCKPGPYQFVRIFDAEVKMGNDGTDDDVKVRLTFDST